MMTAPVKRKGVKASSVDLKAGAAAEVDDVPVDEAPLAVAEAEPEPALAVPEEALLPLFWLPAPVRPGPVPAPELMYFFA